MKKIIDIIKSQRRKVTESQFLIINRKLLTVICQLLIVNCTLLIFLFSCSSPKNEATSPDGKIHLSFNIDDEGFMYYDVKVNDSVFIDSSLLGFEAKNGLNLKNSFVITKTEFTSEDETWTQIWGENKTIRNNYNEMAVHLENEDSIFLTMRFRLFDDGLGFRYEYRITDVDEVIITDELTSFNIKENGTSWSIPADFDSYEHLYRTLPINEIEDANTPFTFKTESGIYASIHEAALIDFPEMTLKKSENLKTIETENNSDSKLLSFSVSQFLSFKSNLAPYPDGKTKAIFKTEDLKNSEPENPKNSQILRFPDSKFQNSLAHDTNFRQSRRSHQLQPHLKSQRALCFRWRLILDSSDEICWCLVEHTSRRGELAHRRPSRRDDRKR